VRVEHTGYAKILDTANRTINRLILTLIIVALIFAAAMTVDLHNTGLLGSQFFGVSYLSILIFGTAVVLGLILLYNVLRSRKY